MKSNPYDSPKHTSANTEARRSFMLGGYAIGTGLLVAIMGWIAWLTGKQLAHDDFDVFLTMFLGASCFVWPATAVAIVFGIYAALRDGRQFLPIVSIGLCCVGIGFVVFAWIT